MQTLSSRVIPSSLWPLSQDPPRESCQVSKYLFCIMTYDCDLRTCLVSVVSVCISVLLKKMPDVARFTVAPYAMMLPITFSYLVVRWLSFRESRGDPQYRVAWLASRVLWCPHEFLAFLIDSYPFLSFLPNLPILMLAQAPTRHHKNHEEISRILRVCTTPCTMPLEQVAHRVRKCRAGYC